MARPTMHPDEVATDAALVRRLLTRQFPEWADLPRRSSRPTAPTTTSTAWASSCPSGCPASAGRGRSRRRRPSGWRRTCRWPCRRPWRSVSPLAERDAGVRHTVEALGGRIDGAAALRFWQESSDAPVGDGAEVWLHGDLLPGNLLVVDGRLSAVIDFGGPAVGDPACDLLPAWNLFSGRSPRSFLAELDVDDAMRLRGRGWALSRALIALPYYWDTNAGIVRQALHALELVLGDGEG